MCIKININLKHCNYLEQLSSENVNIFFFENLFHRNYRYYNHPPFTFDHLSKHLL